MDSFKQYSSIENTYQQWFIDKIKAHGFDAGEFVAQEKVHGANLSFWCDGVQIKCAKRTEFIADGEKFYADSHYIVLERLAAKIHLAFDLARKINPDLKTITIFGELFGGVYPHPDVQQDKNATTIQKGIYYCPHNEFYAFDIMLDGGDYFSVDQANEIFEKTGIFYAHTLFRGTLDDALKYANVFQSTIPSQLGLPELVNNYCEGVVIRPVETCFFPQSSRVIIKNKNEAWEENARHHKRQAKADKVSGAVEQLSEELDNYVNQNRLNNVISKIGQIEPKDFGKLVGLFSEDVFKDFLKDFENEYDGLEKADQKQIKKALGNLSSRLVSSVLQNP